MTHWNNKQLEMEFKYAEKQVLEIISFTIRFYNKQNRTIEHWNNNCEYKFVIGLSYFYTATSNDDMAVSPS